MLFSVVTPPKLNGLIRFILEGLLTIPLDQLTRNWLIVSPFKKNRVKICKKRKHMI